MHAFGYSHVAARRRRKGYGRVRSEWVTGSKPGDDEDISAAAMCCGAPILLPVIHGLDPWTQRQWLLRMHAFGILPHCRSAESQGLRPGGKRVGHRVEAR